MKKMRNLIRYAYAAIFLLLAASVSAQSEDLNKLLDRAGRQMYVQKYEEAILTLQSALKIEPNNFEALHNIGTVHSAVGNLKKARTYFERAYAIDSSNAELNNNLGVSYSTYEDREKAIEFFLKAVKADSGSAIFNANLGMEYLKIGRTMGALPYLHKANSIRPMQPEILFSIGNSYAASSRIDSAEFYYERSAEAGGAGAELYYFLGRIKDKLKKPKDAEASYKTALKLQSDYPDCIRSLAILYITDGRYTEAAVQFELLLAADSSSLGNWVGLGTAYALEGRTMKADSIFNGLYAVDTSAAFQMMRMIREERSRKKEKAKD